MSNNTTVPTFKGGELLAGKYRIERLLGEGGMGVVLAAKHEQLNQNVAIKLLREEALKYTDVVGRFMREARAAVSLRSEHVARVIDVGNLPDGRPFIVMERLEGQDLGDVIEQQPRLAIAESVDWVIQACEAIAEAHAAGIVHRDLKPKNMFLTRRVDGRPLIKVLDFGISKVDPSRAPGEMQLTKTAEVIGSPSYMSPEQLRSSRNVDARTDIWALGVILYELLTGRVPFYAETITELVLVVVTEKEPPVQQVRPEVPPGLAAIIARCLEKAPERRFQNVHELVQALEPFAHGIQQSASDRIAAVAGVTPSRGVPAAASSGSLPPSRINVHGGTSVAWGETQSQVGPAPVRPRGNGLMIGIGLVGLFVILGAAGTTAWYVKHSGATHSTADPPLPPSRKDLPPMNSDSPPPPAVTPDLPPSALPDTRKIEPPPTTKPAPAPPPKPAPAPAPTKSAAAKPDDLSNVGRH